jgi:hypothetical protein
MRTRTKILSGLAIAGALGLLLHVARTDDATERVTIASSEAPRSAAARATDRPALAAPLDVAGMLGTIELATSQDREKRAQDAHFALVRALHEDPEGTTAAIEQFLADAGGQNVSTRVAVGALVAVGAPAMQDVLVEVVKKRAGDPDLVQLVLPSIGFLAEPTVRTETALRTLADAGEGNTSVTARLAVGVMASKLASGDPARSAAIVDGYAARLASARTIDERRGYLDALGNAGTPGAGTAIATQLRDPDPALRGRAALALRLVPTADAETALLGTLADTNERVRESAAWSLAYRVPSPESLRTMLGRLAMEPSERVVSSLLDTVWARRTVDRAAVTMAIRGLASQHASAKIRERAAKLL